MYTKPTLLSRFLLAVYSTVVGYITIGLLLAYLGYDVISQSSVILHFKLDATAVIPGYFLSGLLVLPFFLASNEFRPLHKFIGGAISHFAALMLTTLIFMATYLYALDGRGELAGQVFETTIYFLVWGGIISLALAPIGGFAAWIAYLYIYRKFQRGRFE